MKKDSRLQPKGAGGATMSLKSKYLGTYLQSLTDSSCNRKHPGDSESLVTVTQVFSNAMTVNKYKKDYHESVMDTLKKPVGKTHKSSTVLMGKKTKKQFKKQKNKKR